MDVIVLCIGYLFSGGIGRSCREKEVLGISDNARD